MTRNGAVSHGPQRHRDGVHLDPQAAGFEAISPVIAGPSPAASLSPLARTVVVWLSSGRLKTGGVL